MRGSCLFMFFMFFQVNHRILCLWSEVTSATCLWALLGAGAALRLREPKAQGSRGGAHAANPSSESARSAASRPLWLQALRRDPATSCTVPATVVIYDDVRMLLLLLLLLVLFGRVKSLMGSEVTFEAGPRATKSRPRLRRWSADGSLSSYCWSDSTQGGGTNHGAFGDTLVNCFHNRTIGFGSTVSRSLRVNQIKSKIWIYIIFKRMSPFHQPMLSDSL